MRLIETVANIIEEPTIISSLQENNIVIIIFLMYEFNEHSLFHKKNFTSYGGYQLYPI